MNAKQLKVRLNFISPVMFDRYPGENKTELPPEAKLYLAEDGKVILPSANLMSFLTAENTKSAPKVLYDSREYKSICNALATYVAISPAQIPFLDGDKPIYFKGWDDKIELHEAVARLNKGIPNPKRRPVVNLPLAIEFDLFYVPNQTVSEDMVRDIFERGGLHVGLGTFRPIYGKFVVERWG